MADIQNVLLQIHHRIAPTTKRGQRFQDINSAGSITSTSAASPIVVTTPAAHGLKTGDVAFLYGITTDTVANNDVSNPAWTVTKLTSTTFSLDGSTSGGGGTGGSFVGCLVGSEDSSRLTRQRILDIYNDARRAYVRSVIEVLPEHVASRTLSGVLEKVSNLTFTSGVAALPVGYMSTVLLTDSSSNDIQVIPSSMLNRVKDLESLTLPFVEEQGVSLTAPSGLTYIPNGSTYILRYYGIVPYSLSDILTDVPATEGIRDGDIPFLVEIADALSRGLAYNEALSLASKLLGGKYATKQ